MSGQIWRVVTFFVCSAADQRAFIVADAVFPLVGRQLIAARVGRFPLYDVHSGGYGGCIGRLPDHRERGCIGHFPQPVLCLCVDVAGAAGAAVLYPAH